MEAPRVVQTLDSLTLAYQVRSRIRFEQIEFGSKCWSEFMFTECFAERTGSYEYTTFAALCLRNSKAETKVNAADFRALYRKIDIRTF